MNQSDRLSCGKPLIGVMPLWDEKKDSIWMLPGYLDGLLEAGAIPFIFPFAFAERDLERLVNLCDGILLTGGHDVSPELYGESPLEGLIDACEKRDRMEKIVLKTALKSGKAILGICRGIQLINAVLGGTLYQDLPAQHPSEVVHHQEAPYDLPSHAAAVAADSPLYRCLECGRILVNSCHHQAVKTLAPGLTPMAMAPDGIIEALYMPSHPFLWAVQWHPEFSLRRDENSRKIFAAFVSAAAGRSE